MEKRTTATTTATHPTPDPHPARGVALGKRYHLGCGDTRLADYVNVDVVERPAVDLVMDLNDLRVDAADCFFSHAFFEHLRRDARVPHLRSALKALDSGSGFICYLGLPDFRNIAQLYLEGGPGIVGPVFDLYNVFRYTHGDADAAGEFYFEQLHKSLFDPDEIEAMLGEAGFSSHVAFSYVFPGEPVPVSLGFYATPARRSEDELKEACKEVLATFDGRFVELETLRFEGFRSRGTIATRVATSPLRGFLRPLARKVSMRLARV